MILVYVNETRDTKNLRLEISNTFTHPQVMHVLRCYFGIIDSFIENCLAVNVGPRKQLDAPYGLILILFYNDEVLTCLPNGLYFQLNILLFRA